MPLYYTEGNERVFERINQIVDSVQKDKNVKIKASGSGLGYWDLVSSIKKLAYSNVDFGIK